MEAKVIATGEIVEVVSNGLYYESIKDERIFDKCELEIISKTKTLDYWTRLEHQYAGMAMQGLMSYIEQVTPTKGRSYCDEIVVFSVEVAHALVEKMKEEK